MKNIYTEYEWLALQVTHNAGYVYRCRRYVHGIYVRKRMHIMKIHACECRVAGPQYIRKLRKYSKRSIFTPPGGVHEKS